MDQNLLPFIAGGGTLLVILLVSSFFSPDRRNLRAMRKHARLAIAEAKDGEIVSIQGEIQAVDEGLIAPISGRRCVHYEVTIEEWVKRMKNSGWEETLTEKKSIDFRIADATGTALVETSSFIATVTRNLHTESEPYLDPPKRILSVFKRHKRDALDAKGVVKRLRYEEGVLKPGASVVIVGRARWEDEGAEASEGYRTQRRKRRLVIEAHDEPVRATNDRKAVG